MIYDCFSFFNELDLLEIRLNVLKDVVDKFVLVEAVKMTGIKGSLLPLISLLTGGFICGVGHFVFPDVGGDLLSSIIFGMLCGLAATGGDQAYKKALEMLGRSSE